MIFSVVIPAKAGIQRLDAPKEGLNNSATFGDNDALLPG